jgi:acyl-coenzyme A thioesterase PaaI-like protein
MNDSPIPAAEGVTPESIAAYVAEQWPSNPNKATCIEVSGRHAVVEVAVEPHSIRPGGYISGPAQFATADVALWYASFGAIGLEAMALTSELSIRFLRPATGTILHARADLHSVGLRQLVGSVTIWTNDPTRPTSVAQGGYMAPKPATTQPRPEQ